MLFYFLILFLILGLAYPLCIKNPSSKNKTIYVAIVFACLFFLSAFRYATGSDYFNYLRIFNEIKEQSLSGVFSLSFEIGFALLTKITSKISDDFTFTNAVYSFIILMPVAYVIRRHSKNIWLSCYIYICLTFFYTSMNFTRQSIAASIVLLSYGFIKNKKHLFVIILALIASTFHASALLFIPFYLFTLIKPAKYLYISLGILIIEFYILFDVVYEEALHLLSVILNRDYSAYIDTIYTTSFELYYLIIPLLITVIACFAYFHRWGKEDKGSYFLLSCSVLSFIIWLFITKMMIIERFSLCFYIFTILLIPSIANYYLGDFQELVRLVDIAKVKLFGKMKSKKRLMPPTQKGKYYLIFIIFITFCFIYHIFSLNVGSKGMHSVVPYSNVINSFEKIKNNMSFIDDNLSLKSETDIRNFFIKLTNSRYSCIITTIPCNGLELTDIQQNAFNYIGLETDLSSGVDKCLIAVLERGKLVYEKSSYDDISYTTSLCGYNIDIQSGIQNSNIIIENNQYSLNNQGINITVFEDETGIIVDKVTITLSVSYQRITRFFESYRENIPS